MKKNININHTNRKSVYANLSDFCLYSNLKDTIEVTEWNNGEGFDVDLLYENGKGRTDKRLQLTEGEIIAIYKLYKEITKYKK